MATQGFQRWAKLFALNFSVITFAYIVKVSGQANTSSQSICPAWSLMKPQSLPLCWLGYLCTINKLHHVIQMFRSDNLLIRSQSSDPVNPSIGQLLQITGDLVLLS